MSKKKKLVVHDKTAVCPFFVGLRRCDHQIACEGFAEDSGLCPSFADPNAMDTYKQLFCDAQYRRCDIYRCLMHGKYPSEDVE